MTTTIYYERQVTPNVLENKTVTFDTITGTGINPSKPYVYSYGGKFKQEGYNQAVADGLPGQMQILPKVPSPTVFSTVWLKYPETTPQVRPNPYRCHFYVNGGVAITWLPWSDEYAFVWAALGVFEFTYSLTNNSEKIPNPAYAPIKADYDAKLAQWIGLFKESFLLHYNYLSPVMPTVEDNTNLPLGEGKWRWYLNFKAEGNEIMVNEGDYYCPPVAIPDRSHPKYEAWAKMVCLYEPITRLKTIMGL